MTRVEVPVVPGVVLEQLDNIQSNDSGSLKLRITVNEIELAYWLLRDDIAKISSTPRVHVVARVENRNSYPHVSLNLTENTVEEAVHDSNLDPGPVTIEHPSLLNAGGATWAPGMN